MCINGVMKFVYGWSWGVGRGWGMGVGEGWWGGWGNVDCGYAARRGYSNCYQVKSQLQQNILANKEKQSIID